MLIHNFSLVCTHVAYLIRTVKMLINIFYKNLVPFLFVFACEFSHVNYMKMLIHTVYKKMVSLLWVFV